MRKLLIPPALAVGAALAWAAVSAAESTPTPAPTHSSAAANAGQHVALLRRARVDADVPAAADIDDSPLLPDADVREERGRLERGLGLGAQPLGAARAGSCGAVAEAIGAARRDRIATHPFLELREGRRFDGRQSGVTQVCLAARAGSA
jgi:hypothetical protein